MEAERIQQAVSTVGMLTASNDDLDRHCRWELRELLDRVRMSDLTATEVISLVVILARVHNRCLVQTAQEPGVDRPLLRAVD